MTDFFVRLASWPVAGPAIALMAILAQWETNQLRLGFESAWPTLSGAAALALVATALLRLFSRSWARAGIAVGLVAFYLLYAPAIIGFIRLPYSAAALLSLGVLGTLALIWLRLPTEERKFASIAGRINFLCLALLAATAFPIIAKDIELGPARSKALAALGELDGKAGQNSPDVWHIIFDRYAGADTLRSRYGYDNGPFVDELRRRGFTVVEPAFSNYQRTSHSVASTLNGALLDPMSAHMAGQERDWVPIYRAMQDNAAIRAFNRMGYRTVFAGSWWEPTRTSATASQTISIRSMPQLARTSLDQSSAGFWLRGRKVPWLDGRNDQCFRANEKFRRLRELARNPVRKQVFAHFLVPHPPFVLNEDGSCRTLDQARSASRTENYLAALRFANREALQLVDAILAGPRPAVIVIHSDEGPWPEPYVGNEHGLGTDPVPVRWATLAPEQLREKMGILLAIRDPSGKRPRSMPGSPVQIYPAILRDHFGSKQPLPSSRYSVFASEQALYRFVDVESKLSRK